VHGNPPPRRKKIGIFEIGTCWDNNLFQYENYEMIKMFGIHDDSKTNEQLLHYFGGFQQQ
jgi:hypothetical protein